MKLPPESDLRRVWPMAKIPPALRGPSLARTAHHEAGHVVLLEWVGLDPTEATATDRAGLARFDTEQFNDDDAPSDYDRPLAAAQAAAMYHAGICAELIHAGIPWTGVIVRLNSQDWRNASTILAPHFGYALAGHGFAQRVAHAVLTARWDRVQQIAARLIEFGAWTPEKAS